MSAPFRGHGADEIELKRAKRLEDVRRDAPRYLNTFRRAYTGKSLRAAVNAFCVECNGFDAAAIRECTAPACPLFLYRPGYLKNNYPYHQRRDIIRPGYGMASLGGAVLTRFCVKLPRNPPKLITELSSEGG